MTKDQIQQLSDEELCDQVALTMGVYPIAEGGNGELIILNDKGGVYLYQPTANTEAGKAQCFDLMVEFGVCLLLHKDGYWIVNPLATKGNLPTEPKRRIINKNPQRAICEAVVMSVGGE